MSFINKDEGDSASFEPVGVGPVAQSYAGLGVMAVPATVASGATFTTPILPSDGFRRISAGVKADGLATISIQRYIDQDGLIPQGTAITAALNGANTFTGVANSTDDLPFAFFTVSLINGSGVTLNVAKFLIYLEAR